MSEPAGIDCGPVCAALFPPQSRVHLRAIADPGSTFRSFTSGTLAYECRNDGDGGTWVQFGGFYSRHCYATFTSP